jgi:multidrug efflux pump subunit AcrB
MFHIELHLPPQTSLQGTRSRVDAVSAILKQYAGIERVHWFIGDNAPPFYYNMRQNRDGVPYFAQAMVTARDFKTANRLIPELQTRLDDTLPEAQILVRKLEQGPPFNAPLEVRLYGPNLDTLSARGDELRRIRFATEDVVPTRATLASGTPKVRLQTRDEIPRLAGLSLTDVAGQLQSALDGAVDGSVLEGTEELPVRIRVGNGARQQISDLTSLYLASPAAATGGQHPGVPLAALGEVEIQPARGVIPRRNGERVNVIEAYIRAGILPQTVLQRFQDNLQAAGFALPAGYRIEFGGESAGRNDAIGNLLANIGVIVTLLVVVVVLSFNSFRLSGIIFAVAAQSAGLGFLSIYLFGYPFGFTVIVGLLGLMGLAINAAIVILAELKADERAAAGDSDAILAGVMNSSRHIASTTITTVGGFMPLMLEGGGFWPPFAVAIAGGTVLTTLLSFYFVPALFRLLAQRRTFSVTGGEVMVAGNEVAAAEHDDSSSTMAARWSVCRFIGRRVAA